MGLCVLAAKVGSIIKQGDFVAGGKREKEKGGEGKKLSKFCHLCRRSSQQVSFRLAKCIISPIVFPMDYI